ncbi:MAG: hypothetical protein JST54_24770 [Deltaproteobacteria bacterium]|nr:hypothetical protein [Deltaproteobacteria bacterium]
MSWLLVAPALLALGFTLVATAAVLLERARRPKPLQSWPPLLVLRPCEGDEPELAERLRSTLQTGYAGEVRLVVGHGPALGRVAVEATFIASPPSIDNVNRKAWHLASALDAVPPRGSELVLAIDADVHVTRALLEALASATQARGVVAAFAPPVQHGRPLAARLADAALAGSPHAFLSLAALARLTNSTPPMVGCAIAVRPDALNAIGGFRAVLRAIGDDLALASALSTQGRVAVAWALADCRDPNQGASSLVAQLSRWIRVATAHRPHLMWTYALLIAPLPLAALSLVVTPWVSVALLASRAVLAAVQRALLYGGVSAALWDPLLAEVTWWAAMLGALGTRAVSWRGRRYRIHRGGALEDAS